MSFSLSCRVELTPDENALIARYRAEDQPLTYRTVGDTQIPGLKIGDLVRGTYHELRDVTELLNYEDTIKAACGSFKTLLMVMNSFGGEEVVEFGDGKE